jgi:hypothetical protein
MKYKRLDDAADSEKRRTVGITVRVNVETNRILSAILALKGMTLSGFLHDSIMRFIRDNYVEAKNMLDIDRIAGLDEKKTDAGPDSKTEAES